MPAGKPEQACLQECLNSKSISSLPATASPLFQQQHLLSSSNSTSISSLPAAPLFQLHSRLTLQHICIYIYIHMYINIYKQTCLYIYIYKYIYITKHTRNHIRNSAAPNTHPDDKRKMRTNKQKSQAQPGSETDRFIVYNQSKYCSFRPRVSGSTPGCNKRMHAGTPEQACLQERLNRHACRHA